MNYCELRLPDALSLIRQFGSPLYVFHRDEFENNYLQLLEAFRAIYSKYNIAYSYKTNYAPAIIKAVKNLGGLAEVVSDMEYHLAKKIGYSNKNIIYNGPVKGAGLFEHILHGGVANIDNLDELKSVVDFVMRTHQRVQIAFRLNLDIDQGFVSRFGLDAYEDERPCELKDAFDLVSKVKDIKVVGLHCHIGRSRSLEAWQKRIRVMFKLVDRFFVDSPPEFLDFGSGMNSIMEPSLAEQFGGHLPTYAEYAGVLATAMTAKFGHLPYEKRPWLYTEPGTTVISGYVTFLSTVLSIKTVKGKTYVTFDCSAGNIGDICRLKNLPITVYKIGDKRKQLSDASFVGYTCLEHDHIYEGYNGNLAVGDIVQFRNIGGYSNVFKAPFILPNCAMICLYRNEINLIKRKESLDDVFATYVF